jgi:hypothetical protein
LTQIEAHNVFHVMRVGEHVDRLNGCDLVFGVEQSQIAGLCGRIAADIDDASWFGPQYDVDHIGVHSGAGRIHYHHVGTPVLGDEGVGEHIFHVAGEE